MPKYTSKKKRNLKRERKRVRPAIPRDRRHLKTWAAKGTEDDYARFRKHVAKVAERAPSYIHAGSMDQLNEPGHQLITIKFA